VIEMSPEWVTGSEQGESSGRIATFSLLTGMFWDGIPSFLMKQLRRIASFVGTGYTTRR
jgi:hypothetical protein